MTMRNPPDCLQCRLYDNSRHCGNPPWDWSGAKVRNPNYYAP